MWSTTDRPTFVDTAIRLLFGAGPESSSAQRVGRVLRGRAHVAHRPIAQTDVVKLRWSVRVGRGASVHVSEAAGRVFESVGRGAATPRTEGLGILHTLSAWNKYP